jgi:3-methyl-2-oxobutanoate hydroxymethyltransferase
MRTVLDFEKMKLEKQKISMATCYDYWSASILAKSDIDCILVGDSLAMVMHGHPNTLAATPEMMALHTSAVFRGSPDKFIVADMPFLSYRKGISEALNCVDLLMKAGAHAVKLEGIWGHEDVVRSIVQSGVPVMGHLGLTPQSIHSMGGYKVQAREKKAADDLVKQAQTLTDLGAFAIVLECIPQNLATEITQAVHVPTIGIGAGAATDGQVLVLQDLLGANGEFKPKFLRQYANLNQTIVNALNQYHSEVRHGKFPNEQESYA